ncbi:limonene-1,2-epoxide hydrolase family protein [Mycobacterium sp. NPDC051804]
MLEGKPTSWPVMGAYEVKNGKITSWREYFYPPS